MADKSEGTPVRNSGPSSRPQSSYAKATEDTPSPKIRFRESYWRKPPEARRAKGGAGDGNRTHVTSLEGWGSTVELHPLETHYT